MLSALNIWLQRIYYFGKYILFGMKEEEILLGEVVIIKKQNIFRRIGNLFKKKDKKNCH